MLLTLSKRQCVFDLESNNHSKRMHFQESERMFRYTLKGKNGITQL